MTPDEIRKRFARLSAASAEYWLAKSACDEVVQLATRLIGEHSRITDRGTGRIGKITLDAKAGQLRAEELVYCGEGHYEPQMFERRSGDEVPSVIRIPLEWLSMEWHEVRHTIQVEHKRRNAERDHREAEKERIAAERLALEREQHRRKMFEELKAEFGEASK